MEEKADTCLWTRNGQLVVMYPGKYEWSGRPESGDCSLVVRNSAWRYDQGVWRCSVAYTSYLQNSYFRDTLESDPARLVIRGIDTLSRDSIRHDS